MPRDQITSVKKVDASTNFAVEEYERLTPDMQYNLLVMQEWIEREEKIVRPRVKRDMTEEEFAQVLIRVSKASTAKELAAIRHESPDWDHMTEQMCTQFSRAVDERRIFLKEVDRVSSKDMQPYERAQFISLQSKSTARYAQELTKIAREVQARATKDMNIKEIYSYTSFIAGYGDPQVEEKQDKSQNATACKLKV